MSRLNSFDVRSLPSHECGVFSVLLKPPTVAHFEGGMGYFANQEFTEGDEIGYYYSMPDYQFMVSKFNARNVHGDCMIAVTRDEFYMSAMRLTKEVCSLDGVFHTVRLVPQGLLAYGK